MLEDNHNGNEKKTGGSTSALNSMEVIEFNWPLFVYQRRASGEGDYLFTIGVWNGTKLMPICHLQPFQTALAALGQALIKAGRSQSVSPPSAGGDSNGLSTGLNTAERPDARSLSATDDNGRP